MIVIIVLVLAILLGTYFSRKVVSKRTIRYTRIGTEGKHFIKLPQAFQAVFDEDERYEHTTVVRRANIVFFEKLTDFHSFYDTRKSLASEQIYYSLACVDHISCKSRMYAILEKQLGTGVRRVVPHTLILGKNSTFHDIENFFQEQGCESLIFKSNVQQQQGIQIIVSLDDLETIDLKKYVVVQELLLDPYLIAGHKINIRQYILATCDASGDLHFFAFNDGFIYYAPGKFGQGGSVFDTHVTTGYGDRNFYRMNPLTMKDFEMSLGLKKREVFNTNRIACLRTIFQSLKNELKQIEKQKPGEKFTIFGADLAISSELDVLLLEINKGPDLRFKDDRDGELKRRLIRSTLDFVVNHRLHDFIHL